jgi:hypothetical protein
MKRISKEIKEEGERRCAKRGAEKSDEYEKIRRTSTERVRLTRKKNRREIRSGQKGRRNGGRDRM